MSLHDPGLTRDRDDTPVGIVRPIPDERRADTWWARRRDRMAARSPARRNAGRVVRALLVLLAAAAGYYLISLYQVWSTGRSDQARPVDAIVVMGAAQYDGRPSPQLAARLDHVAELWPQGLAPLVVVTGGNQPGDRFTEAEASAAYLEERGVPAEAIVREGEGRTSYESLQGVARLLEERGLDSVLIVTDPFHSLRSRLIAEDAGLEAYVSPTPTSVVTGGRSFVRHLEEAAGVAVGRLFGFDRL
jgi:uncharacterized SAM-binding protein YcdF (DUF218 family)